MGFSGTISSIFKCAVIILQHLVIRFLQGQLILCKIVFLQGLGKTAEVIRSQYFPWGTFPLSPSQWFIAAFRIIPAPSSFTGSVRQSVCSLSSLPVLSEVNIKILVEFNQVLYRTLKLISSSKNIRITGVFLFMINNNPLIVFMLNNSIEINVIKCYNNVKGGVVMGYRRKHNTAQNIQRKKTQGRGRIESTDYKPGIYTYEIPSKGKVARIKGFTTNRVHHCLSQHEKFFFLLLDYDPEIFEIYEQVLLELEYTFLIAAELKIEHPYADQCPAQMSTDFVYRKGDQWYAVAIKTSQDVKKSRVQEKLKIEQLYWERKGIPWRVVTEEEIPRQTAINYQWLHSGEPLENLVPDKAFLENIIAAFLDLYQDYTIPFSEIIDTMESYRHLQPGTMIQIFKHLILDGKIRLDLSIPINTTEPRTRFPNSLRTPTFQYQEAIS